MSITFFKRWMIALVLICGLVYLINLPSSHVNLSPESTEDRLQRESSLLLLEKISSSSDKESALNKLSSLYKEKRISEFEKGFFSSQIYLNNHDYKKAYDILIRLVQKYPNSPEAMNNLAAALSGMGQYERAVNVLRSAIRRNTVYEKIYNNMSKLSSLNESNEYLESVGMQPQNKPSDIEIITTISQ